MSVPNPIFVNDETKEGFIEEVDELCAMLDKDAKRGVLYVRWICNSLRMNDNEVLKAAGESAMRLQQEMGLGAIVSDEPFELPMLMARLAGAATTFCAKHGETPPPSVLDTLLVGAILPAVELRSRARDAMADNLLEAVDTVLLLSTHVLAHLYHHTTEHSSHVNKAVDANIQTCIRHLVDLLDDAREETYALAVHIVVFLQAFSPTKTIYGDIQKHPQANTFGTTFINLINRGAFGKSAADDLVDIAFAQMVMKTESQSVKHSHPSSVLFPRDVAVLAEVLEREIRDEFGTSTLRGKGYAALLHTIATSALKPAECSIDFTKYLEPPAA